MSAPATTTPPRSGRPVQPAGRRARRIASIVAVWHAGCLILGNTGCFVTWPMPLIDENLPPEIKSQAWQEDDTVVLDAEGDAWVVVVDDTDEMPLFTWQIGSRHLPDVPQRNETEDGLVSWLDSVVIPYEADFDGEELRVTVSDAGGASVEMAWPVEVL